MNNGAGEEIDTAFIWVEVESGELCQAVLVLIRSDPIRSGGRGGGFMFWTGFAIRYRNMPDSQLKFPAF